MGFGPFSSDSDSFSNIDRSGANTNAVSDRGSFSNSQPITLKVSGGGKKSKTNVTNNVQVTDFGSVKAGIDAAVAGAKMTKDISETALGVAMGALDGSNKLQGQALSIAENASPAAIAGLGTKALMLGGAAVLVMAFVLRGKM